MVACDNARPTDPGRGRLFRTTFWNYTKLCLNLCILQQSNRPQPPFSDAYISGMSAKRRKIIQSEKPTASVECLIANGVQRAIQSVGLGGSNGGSASNASISMDTVIGSIAHDSTIQAAYTDAVRNSLKERTERDVDFKTSKYPQIAKFTEQK